MKMKISTALALFALLAAGFLFETNAQADPASLDVRVASGPITVDGILNESDWSADVPRLMFQMGGTGGGNVYTPTGGAVVKEPYTDVSTTYVRFLRSGMNLYIALQSNDKQVCRFDWEGDGLFMKIKNSANADVEYKLYVGAAATFVYEGNASATGMGVADGTIYDSTDVDNGYTAELVIHLDQLGYAAVPASIGLLINIFDPDNYSTGVPPWGPNGNYYKQWWGSEWGPDMRLLNLTDIAVPVELTSFSASAINGGVQLQWQTATEKNNQGFEIQKSSDKANYKTIDFVKGFGTTTDVQNYSYTDKNASGVNYYRLKQVDFDGQFSYSKVVEVTAVPSKYELSQNYPNPFNPTTNISYSVAQNSFVSIKVYNVLGNEVASLVNGNVDAGTHNVTFNASGLSTGIYYYTIKAGNFTATKKLVLMK